MISYSCTCRRIALDDPGCPYHANLPLIELMTRLLHGENPYTITVSAGGSGTWHTIRVYDTRPW